MNEDTITVHRLRQLETGFADLRHKENELKKEISGVSSDVKLLAKTMSDLTTQITALVRQNTERDSQRVDEIREKVTQEGRFAKIELQLRILAIVSSAATVSISGILISTLMSKAS